MNTETVQTEDLNDGAVAPAEGVDTSGAAAAADGATSDGEQQHEGEVNQGDQEEKQGKSANRNARRRRLQQESEAEKAQLREDNRKLAERLETLESQVDGVINPPAPRPQRVDFDSEEDYEDELHDWRNPKPAASQKPSESLEQPAPMASQQPAQQPISAEVKKVVDDFNDSVDAAAEKYEDFDKVTSETNAPMTDIMRDCMIESSNGGEVLYHLSKNSAEAVRIAGLPIAQQVREISEINKKFAPSTTDAPEPIDTIKTGDAGGGSKRTDPQLAGATFE